MAQIELSPKVGNDLKRIVDHLERYEVENPASRIDEIIHAIAVLELNPLIGRPTSGELRELVIGKKSHGYVALYRYSAIVDTVFVLAVRAQREAGYSD